MPKEKSINSIVLGNVTFAVYDSVTDKSGIKGRIEGIGVPKSNTNNDKADTDVKLAYTGENGIEATMRTKLGNLTPIKKIEHAWKKGIMFGSENFKVGNRVKANDGVTGEIISMSVPNSGTYHDKAVTGIWVLYFDELYKRNRQKRYRLDQLTKISSGGRHKSRRKSRKSRRKSCKSKPRR